MLLVGYWKDMKSTGVIQTSFRDCKLKLCRICFIDLAKERHESGIHFIRQIACLQASSLFEKG